MQTFFMTLESDNIEEPEKHFKDKAIRKLLTT